MSVADLQELEEIKGLVTRGQQLGVLTYADIATAVSELDLDEADVEELHGFLERPRSSSSRKSIPRLPRPRWSVRPTAADGARRRPRSISSRT
jgi:Sigma-70 factor, region 1.